MKIVTADITGSLILNGVDITTVSVSSSIWSGSIAGRVTNLESTASSLTAASASFSSRVSLIEGNYATTGSNTFRGNQIISGSLTTTGQIIAQTLNVQQVTSSIVFSSGSNIFGNSLSNTQQLTGSVRITGSLTVNNNPVFLQGGNSFGAQALIGTNDNQSLALETGGTIRMTVDTGGNVGIGTASPSQRLTVSGGNILQVGPNDTGFIYHQTLTSASTGGGLWGVEGSTANQLINGTIPYATVLSSTSSGTVLQLGTVGTVRATITTSGNVGIGTTSPLNTLHVAGIGRFDTGIYLNNSSTNGAFVWQIANESLRFGTNDTERMRITSAGNVGIGTSAPNTLAEFSAGGARGFYITPNLGNYSVYNSAIGFGGYFDNSTTDNFILPAGRNTFGAAAISGEYDGSLSFYTYNNGSTAAATVSQSSARRIYITPLGIVLIGTTTDNYNHRLQVQGIITAKSGDNAVAFDPSVRAVNAFTIATGSPASLILNSNGGNVGIGTTSPSSLLTIGNRVGNATYSGDILINQANNSLNSTGGLEFKSDGAGNGYGFKIQSLFDGSSAYDLTFQSRTNSASWTERMRITSGGDVLVGTSSSSPSSNVGVKIIPTGRVYCVSSDSSNSTESYGMYSTGAANYRFYVGWGGTIYATSTSISGISDATLKTNIRDLDRGINDLMQLKPRRFDWINGDGNDNMGFVAQEIEEIFPELVSEYRYSDTETKKSLKMGDLIPVLVKAIQELKSEIDQLKSQ